MILKILKKYSETNKKRKIVMTIIKNLNINEKQKDLYLSTIDNLDEVWLEKLYVSLTAFVEEVEMKQLEDIKTQKESVIGLANKMIDLEFSYGNKNLKESDAGLQKKQSEKATENDKQLKEINRLKEEEKILIGEKVEKEILDKVITIMQEELLWDEEKSQKEKEEALSILNNSI